MSDNRPPVYYELDENDNPTLIIRTSAIGSSCLWELVAAGQGYEMSDVPPDLQRAFDDGNMLEPLIIGTLESQGYKVTGRQDEGHLDIEPGLLIRYHPDGIISLPEGYDFKTRVLEVKALSDALWQKAAKWGVETIFTEYAWQMSVMMHSYDLPGLWVAYNKGNADGSECADQGRLLFQPIDHPLIGKGEIIDRARLIKEMVDGEDILSSGRPCDDPSHFPCRFLYLRPEPETGNVVIEGGKTRQIVEVADEDKEEVDRLAREYLMFKGQADESKKRADEARNRLIEIAGGLPVKLKTDKWIIPIIEGTNSSPDWAAMPSEVRDRARQYVKQSKYKYLKGIKPLD